MDWGMMQDPNLVIQSACGGGAGLIPRRPSDIIDTTADGTPIVVSSSHKKKEDRTCHRAFLRPTLRYGTTISTWIVIADCLLRFSWTLRFAHHLFPSNDSFVLFTQFLEVFRRSIWNLLRVEWENIKQRRVISLEHENHHHHHIHTTTNTSTTDNDEEEQQYLLPSSLSGSFDNTLS